MFPIYWRYLLFQFLKVLLLSTTAFVAILLTTRLEEIANFATMGSTFWLVLRFAANQVPYILPIAIPISCLIASLLLMQRLSTTYELTAFRGAGLSLRKLLTPILIIATYLTLANFFIVSELATDSHLFNNLVKNELRSVNPLILLHNKHILKMKGIHFDTLGASRVGVAAGDVLFAMPSHDHTHMHVVIGKNLMATPQHFYGDHLSLITQANGPGTLLIENIGHASITIPDFSKMMQKKVSKIQPDQLRFGLLRAKLAEETDPATQTRITSEMVRRFSVAFAALTFTFMGCAFGINIGRRASYRGVFSVLILSSLFLVTYFSAKGIDDHLLASSILYLAPQALIIALSIWMLKRASGGIE